MTLRPLFALVFGVLVTAGELAVVLRFNRPDAHPERQAPERTAPRPIVALAAPRPISPELEAPSEAPPPARAPLAAPQLAPSALPGLAVRPRATRRGVDLPVKDTLPEAVEPDTTAVPRRRPSPTYPAEARRRGIEGYVVVRMRVGADGRVTDVVVVDADPPGVFDESARRAANSYLFSPARSGGRSVATTLEQRIVFRLR